MKRKHTKTTNQQTNLITMKSTKYLVYLKTILLIGQTGLYFSNPTVVEAGDKSALSLGFFSSRHLDYRTERPYGYLTVYSATDRAEDGDLPYYPHSSYAIYTMDGMLFKQVENHLSATDETPDSVSLPIGSYVVEARSDNSGYVRRPVTINSGQRTILDLEMN
jgi:hypothetical protein